jgi:hypothetical protein
MDEVKQVQVPEAPAVNEADANRLAKQNALLAGLQLKKAEALAADDFGVLKELAPRIKHHEAYLQRLQALPGMRANLKSLKAQELWENCEQLQKEILALERGHWGRKLGLWDVVERNGVKGLVVQVDQSSVPLKVLFETGETDWVETSDVAFAGFDHGHSGTYRFHVSDGPESSFALFGPEGPSKITKKCSRGGAESVACTHEHQPRGGIGRSHWSCCGQADVFTACVEYTEPKKRKVGDVVQVDDVCAVVTAVDEDDTRLPYRVALERGGKPWRSAAELRDAPEATVKAVHERSWAPHKGEFRAGKAILFSGAAPGPVGRLQKRKFCSRPDQDEEDGLACAHKAEDDQGPVKCIKRPHWSCCGQGDLFAPKCEFKPDSESGHDDHSESLGGMLAQLAFLQALRGVVS